MTISTILLICAFISALIGVFNPPVPINLVALAIAFALAAQLFGSGVIKF